ncbi:hypothetical protein [Micromonospora craniellae]|nr:hypothetical protein [Micromonospora craniellae]
MPVHRLAADEASVAGEQVGQRGTRGAAGRPATAGLSATPP